MGFKNLQLRLKAFWRTKTEEGESRTKEKENRKKPTWMMPISHGFHVLEGRLTTDEAAELDSEPDSVVIQREQIEGTEIWFFGVFDARIGDGVTKYMQSHLFDKKPKESRVRRKTKETMRRAYLSARAKTRETEAREETRDLGSASAVVINGEKLVMGNMGNYRAIVCRNGEAYQINKRHQQTSKKRWSPKLIPGGICMPKVGIFACDYGNLGGKPPKSSELIVVGSERIEPDTEFVILASPGIWEAMRHQEAVSLVRHIEDPQEAAECLAKEALTRMSKSNISCLVIRFE